MQSRLQLMLRGSGVVHSFGYSSFSFGWLWILIVGVLLTSRRTEALYVGSVEESGIGIV